MGLYINYNAASVNSMRNLNTTMASLNKSMERLSTGYKINRAGDGPSGLLLSEGLRAQIRGSQAAATNVQQGSSMINAADGAMQSTYSVLQRIREIAVSASTATANASSYQAEYLQLRSELDSISNNSTYNGRVLLDGSIAGGSATWHDAHSCA